MKEATQKALVEAAENLGLDEERVSAYDGGGEKYRGRGMRKATCAVVFHDYGEFMACAAHAAGLIGIRAPHYNDLVQDLRGLAFDAMGLDKVAY